MHFFRKVRGQLHAEQVPLARIAREVGTPTYVYSAATLRRHYRVLDRAFGAREHLVCYSVKANSNLALLALLAGEGSGFDIVSGGELYRALATGADPRRIVFSGVGKSDEEIAYALDTGILLFNVESEEELARIGALARRRGTAAPVALRVNPAIDPQTHHHIATGLRTSKFGVPLEQAAALYRRHRRTRGLRFVGIDCHIGSQLTRLAPLREAVRLVAGLYQTLAAEGFPLRILDVGGGLGITYVEEQPPSPAEYTQTIAHAAGPLPETLITEPGRMLVGNAGLLLCRVLYRKHTGSKRFVIVDAGMNDLIRPALYEAHHGVEPVRRRPGRAAVVDVVGPVCESADALARGRRLAPVEPGDLLAIMSAGAYGMSMASNYNSRPRPAEVLVDGAQFAVVRERERWTDLVRGERAVRGSANSAGDATSPASASAPARTGGTRRGRG